MIRLFIFILTSFSSVAFAQITTITTSPESATLMLNAKVVKKPTRVNLNENPELVYIAQLDGYASQGISIEQLKNKNVTNYTFNLEKVHPVPENYTSKKMEVIGFVDRADKAGYWAGFGYTAVRKNGDYLNETYYLNQLNEKAKSYGYNCVIKNNVFAEKSDESQFKIAGEIQALSKDTHGSGFQVSIVVNWTVFDKHEGKVVFEIAAGGYANINQPNYADACKAAINNSLPTLLGNLEFQKVLSSKTNTISKGDTTLLKIPKTIAIKPESGAALSKKSLESVVTIRTSVGHGSGFIISSDGYIITNKHVIGNDEKVEVIFNNGFEFEGEVLRTNSERDIALIKIKGKGLTPLPLKSSASDNIYPGLEAIAIGTPESQELSQSVSKGIISGKRTFNNIPYLQTDIAVNSGNSGGPIISIETGEVIGVVVLKVKGAGIEGINFAIPIEDGLKALHISME